MGSEAAAFRRPGEIVLWEIVGETVAPSFRESEKFVADEVRANQMRENLLADDVSVTQQPRPAAALASVLKVGQPCFSRQPRYG